MAKFSTEQLRNVGVVGHGGTGKTTLVGACLYTAGAVNRLGRVEEGNTVTDFEPEEIERQISIQSALAYCDWRDHRVTFIDTPGYSVFRSETKASMRVADGFLTVVDAVSGAEVMTEKAWQYAGEFELPGLFVINRLDRERADFDRALESLQEMCGREVVALQLPLGREHDFDGVVDLVEMKAYRYDPDGSGRAKSEEIPDELRPVAEERREALVEMIAEADEELMEAFFEAGTLDDEQLARGLHDAVRDRQLFPVLCVSASRNVGTDRVLDALATYMPSPAERPTVPARSPDGDELELAVDADGPFAALVFKTISDPYAGRISMMKVFSGKAAADAPVENTRAGIEERLSNLSVMQGKEIESVDEVVAGQLCAVAKLKETTTGDTLCDPARPVVLEHVDYPEAAISFAVQPLSQGDEEKISQALARLSEEDPTLRVERDPQTKELLISGLGQLHVEVTVAKLERKFGVHTKLKPPKVPYRETIRRSAGAEGRHKKQTGGRGQFAVAEIELAPLPRGSGFEFVDEIFGGAISQSFRPAVEKGIVEAAEKGVLAGFPLVDFKATLLDGKEHSVDSSEIAFKIAGSLAFRQAAPQAAPVLLEPIMLMEITVPDESMGDVMGDLNGRRGRVQGMDPRGSMQIIRAEVPMAEALTYSRDLNSLTGGRGSYHMEFSHYDEVPSNIAQRIIDESKRADEEDD